MKPITTSWGLIIDPTKVVNISQVHKIDTGYQFTITFKDSSTNVVCATEQIAFDSLVEVLQKSAVYEQKRKDRPLTIALWVSFWLNVTIAVFDIVIKHYKL